MFIINAILKLEIEVLSIFGTNLIKKFHFRNLSVVFIPSRLSILGFLTKSQGVLLQTVSYLHKTTKAPMHRNDRYDASRLFYDKR